MVPKEELLFELNLLLEILEESRTIYKHEILEGLCVIPRPELLKKFMSINRNAVDYNLLKSYLLKTVDAEIK